MSIPTCAACQCQSRSRTQTALKLSLMLALLTAPALAQKATTSAASVQQQVVLRYFRDVLDGAKVEVLDSLVLPGCAIHRPEGELKGVAALRNMVAARRPISPISPLKWTIFSSPVIA